MLTRSILALVNLIKWITTLVLILHESRSQAEIRRCVRFPRAFRHLLNHGVIWLVWTTPGVSLGCESETAFRLCGAFERRWSLLVNLLSLFTV